MTKLLDRKTYLQEVGLVIIDNENARSPSGVFLAHRFRCFPVHLAHSPRFNVARYPSSSCRAGAYAAAMPST